MKRAAIHAPSPPRTGLSLALPLAALAVALALTGAITGCKRHKPPARSRVWMGAAHTCSMHKTGELECWGNNDAGQLGDGTREPRSLPTPVTAPAAFAAAPAAPAAANAPKVDEMALGAHHTCALSAGAVRCWGSAASAPAKTPLPLPPGITAIAASGDRTCVLAPTGIRCWDERRPAPYQPDLLTGPATALAIGGDTVCAALTEARAVRCAGPPELPVTGQGKPMFAGASVTALTVGSRHACVALGDGTIQCWGANDKGQLGDGTTTDSATPVLVHGVLPAASVHAGTNHTCARLRNNTVACWGDNAASQLANGTTTPSSRPTPVQGLTGVAELAVGGDAACARFADGGVRCWGANAFGQLGDGSTVAHNVPMAVRSPAASASP